jgi:hypothetical protein
MRLAAYEQQDTTTGLVQISNDAKLFMIDVACQDFRGASPRYP